MLKLPYFTSCTTGATTYIAMTLLLILLSTLYASIGWFAWRFGSTRGDSRYPLRGELLVLVPALFAHSIAVWQPMLINHAFLSGIGFAMVLIAWLMLMLYWGGSFFYPLKGLQLLLYPFASIALLIALLLPHQAIQYETVSPPLLFHIISSLLAYSLFAISALVALLILLRDHTLHQRRFSPLTSFLPPLLSLEKLMFQSMIFGFLLLSASMISGTVFADIVFGRPMMLTHKTVFGILAWLIYGSIWLLHATRKWRGRQAALWNLAGFASLMLAYLGSKFVLQIILNH